MTLGPPSNDSIANLKIEKNFFVCFTCFIRFSIDTNATKQNSYYFKDSQIIKL